MIVPSTCTNIAVVAGEHAELTERRMATILTVDDRAIDREFLATLLGYVGYDVLQASDGEEALQVVQSRHPDLVITDLQLPTMGAAEFADRVHDDPQIAGTPIIFYTATYRVTEARVLAQSCRAAAVLAKPAEPQDILDAVGAVLGTHQAAVLEPHVAIAHPGFLGAKLPEYLQDLTGLQRRLRRTLDEAIERAESRRVAATDADAVEFSFQSLSLRLATLLELDVALSSERDPREMLKLFCRAAQDLLNCKYAAVGIVDSGGRRLQHIATRGLDENVAAQFGELDHALGLFGMLLASGKPHRTHEHTPGTLGLPAFHPPISSLLAVPIPAHASKSRLGWVYFADRFGPEAFDGEDAQFAVTLAAQLALAYGNLALYEEARQHTAKLEVEVHERRRAQGELAHRTTHDQITGLPRFVLIEEHLQSAIVAAAAHDGRVILLYVDIDRFHMINETRGRSAGDDVLRTVASRLCTICGSDGYVAHVAADEFAVLLVDVGTRDQVEFAESIRRGIEETIHHGDQRIYITCSIGVSCFPDNGASPRELLRQSEAAMLRAKGEGRNTVNAFSNEHKEALEDRSALGMRLSDAIRDGQLVVHYQPQISADDWRILGFEALVRWQSPEFGLLPPARFLDVAEDLGLIVDIGNFVFDSACRLSRAWLDAGWADFSISINVSSLQLQRPDFVDTIQASLREHAVPAQHLELELTESMMVGNVERAIATMRALKALELHLALDDFGTGYSSLNYLRRFPIDKLKIDQSFVRDIRTDAGAAGICRAIITLGHQLGMTVLAEGVETAEQVGYLRRHGCDQFQGFYFGRPVAAPQAFEILKSYGMADGIHARQDSAQTLLLVHDGEKTVRALTSALRRDGYRILVAPTAEKALDLLARNDVQVIVLEHGVATGSGAELMTTLKEMYPDTCCILLGGDEGRAKGHEARGREADTHLLAQPWGDDDLRVHVREAFHRHRSRLGERRSA